jgi:hypothetical protein
LPYSPGAGRCGGSARTVEARKGRAFVTMKSRTPNAKDTTAATNNQRPGCNSRTVALDLD